MFLTRDVAGYAVLSPAADPLDISHRDIEPWDRSPGAHPMPVHCTAPPNAATGSRRLRAVAAGRLERPGLGAFVDL